MKENPKYQHKYSQMERLLSEPVRTTHKSLDQWGEPGCGAIGRAL